MFCTCPGLLQWPHTNTIISVRLVYFDDFGIVYIDLVVVSLLTNLPLHYFTIVYTKFLIFLPHDFNLFFQTKCENCKKVNLSEM